MGKENAISRSNTTSTMVFDLLMDKFGNAANSLECSGSDT